MMALAERIVLCDERPVPAPGRWAIHEAIFQALATQVQIRIWSSEGGTSTASKVSPYRLSSPTASGGSSAARRGTVGCIASGSPGSPPPA
jgi:hypothetical protein